MGTARLPLERMDHGPAAGVVTMTLRQEGRPVVVLDSDLLRAIDATLDEVADAKGFVLASDSRVFVAGANLQEIMGLSDKELDEYLRFGSRVYGRIAAMPWTTVAAINGAALGGGLEIAMHCDHLIAMAPGEREYQVGLPEAGLKICPGWGGTNLLPARMDAGRAMEMTASGATMKVSDAARAGLIEEMEPDHEALLCRARALAAVGKPKPRTEPIAITNPEHHAEAKAGLERVRSAIGGTASGASVVACVEAGLSGGWEAALACERASLIRLRNSDEGRGAIEAFFAKSTGKK
ncbi:MAG: enoyl-CoA hydratase/isomerase family protein [Phycisphaerales bacterium]|nr:enoyl-CoA hydratase/isomerase family protein [Phycisphaerales bacterium]